MPNTELTGKRNIVLQAGTITDEKNGVEATLAEKLIEILAVGKLDYVLGNGFNINVTDTRTVEFIEYQNFQQDMTNIRVSRELRSKLGKRFFG